MGDSRNARRFTGFADTYDATRPSVPLYPVTILSRYLGHQPDTVLDLGCGTGLSTEIWRGQCRRAYGIEPSADMLAVARRRESADLQFIQAYADEIPLADGIADIIVCSQSFHWMTPDITLREVNRLLSPGGIFATIDYDWPPVMKWEAEVAYQAFSRTVHDIERQEPSLHDTCVRYPKSGHLAALAGSGHFRYTREVLFASEETFTPERLAALPLSMGGVQTILKRCPEKLTAVLSAYQETVRGLYAEPFPATVCYRMRLGIK